MSAELIGKQVVVAIWESNEHGIESRVFMSDAGAEGWRQEIAECWWEQEMEGKEMPDDPAEAADAYFEHMGERGFNGEYFTTQLRDIEK
jgi:hypothetical protein